MGETENKLLMLLMGAPVIAHTLRIFERHGAIDAVIIAAPEDEKASFRELISSYGLIKVKDVITGGGDRQESVYNLLRASAAYDKVAIHDGARPFLTDDALSSVLSIPDGCDGAILGTPLKDTIKRVDSEGIITDTPRRSDYFAVQTPQVFLRSRILEAHEKALSEGYRGTDDAGLLERYGGRIKIIEGPFENIKITTREDLLIGEAILRRKTGEAP